MGEFQAEYQIKKLQDIVEELQEKIENLDKRLKLREKELDYLHLQTRKSSRS